MTLPITQETISAAYDYLCTTPPFNSWNLPGSEDVTFRVVRAQAVRGWYLYDNGKHIIAISTHCIGRSDSLIATLGHEMVHLMQRDTRIDTPRAEHNAAFKKLAIQVCQYHGWDPKLF